MNPQKIKEIKDAIKNTKLTYSQIGEKFGCSKQYIGHVAKKFNLGRKKNDPVKK